MNVESTIDSNNAAIACICQGELNEARTLLLSSIRSMRSQLSIEDADPPTKSLTNRDVLYTASNDICLRSVSVLRLKSDHCFHQRTLDSSPLCLFDRVYLIQSECVDNQDLICATILYNMAMVLHLENLSGRSSLFNEIEKLYHMCDATVQDCKHTCSEACLLNLAALNNAAHINSMYLKAHETNRALDGLVSELALLDREISIGQDDLLIFQMNAFLHSHNQGFRTAPSA